LTDIVPVGWVDADASHPYSTATDVRQSGDCPVGSGGRRPAWKSSTALFAIERERHNTRHLAAERLVILWHLAVR